MKIQFVRFMLILLIPVMILIGCSSEPATTMGTTKDLINVSIPTDEYEEQAKVVIDWMHKNGYGLRQSDYFVVPLYFDSVPNPLDKTPARNYTIAHHGKNIMSGVLKPKNAGIFYSAENKGITLEVYQNHLTIRIKDIGQAHLPIAILDEIASAQRDLGEREGMVYVDPVVGKKWRVLVPMPTSIQSSQGKAKAVVEWMQANNYSIVIQPFPHDTYFIRTENGKLSDPFYVGQIQKFNEETHKEILQRHPEVKDTDAGILLYAPNDVVSIYDVVEKIVVGDFELQTDKNQFIIQVKGVGEARFPLGDENRRVGKPISDAKLFQSSR